MRRSARVLQADRPVSVRDSSEPAVQVLTDHPQHDERAFHLRLESPLPEMGSLISYGDHRAWYIVAGRQIVARKVGYNFDPDSPLR